jgi:transcriptional regulator with XRE-family HTH domain
MERMSDRSLRALRESAGLRRIDVAVKLGVDLSTVTRWETGRMTPRATYLLMMADMYGVDPREIDITPSRQVAGTAPDETIGDMVSSGPR